MLQVVAVCVAVGCSGLQWVAVCCSVLQCVIVCCRVLQCVAECCVFGASVYLRRCELRYEQFQGQEGAASGRQWVAVGCSGLQYVAVY